MTPLTCNQMMVLLDCYRGTVDPERHMGTFNDDLKFLHKAGLIDKNNDCTDIGLERVQTALNGLEIPKHDKQGGEEDL